ncbi:NAD(P)H-binding protein [Methylophaga sp.]|uniref:NAD(P)H-binding protein n=1 Tax=Methylophaga sp. TaxID=2024840 RepID=UPI0025DB7796|nr:NAD(P)H-binding protein [Methylophaga sp.]
MGRPLAAHLTALGHPIKLSTRSEAKQAELKQAGFDAYLVDIDKDEEINADFLSAEILIINITSKNSAGFKRLVTAIERSKISKLLFVSSSSVYQNLNREVTEDEGAENPDSPLFQIEQLFQQSSSFSTTILRFSGLVGRGRHPGRFFRGGKTIKQPDAPINLIHFDDCIGIIDAIVRQGVWGEKLNGCSDTHPKKREFYADMAQLAGVPLADFAEDDTLKFKIVSNQKIKQRLRYQLQHRDLMQLNQEHYE